jgi:hypothetical protein
MSAGPVPSPSEADGRVQVWREQGEVCAYGYAAGEARWMHVPDLATFRLGSEVVAFPLPSVEADAIRDAFERNVLPMALQALGGEALHGSGVVGAGGVVALCGESGTGKSTLAYALSTHGYPPWADDAVAFESGEAGVVAVPLPFRLTLDAESAAMVARAPAAERARPSSSLLATVAVLRRDPGRPLSVRRLRGADALAAALEQGYCFDPDDAERNRKMVEAYLELAARVPVVEVRFDPGWARFEALMETLKGIAGSG